MQHSKIIHSVTALVLGSTVVWSSGLALMQPLSAQAAASKSARAHLGSPAAFRQSDLETGPQRVAAIKAAKEDQVAITSASSIHGSNLVGAPNINENLIQSTTTWDFLTAQATDAAGHLYVAYLDTKGLASAADTGLYFHASSDGGTSWSPEQRLDHDSGTLGVGDSHGFALNIAADANGNVIVIWDDTRGGIVDGQMYYRISRNAGATWGPVTQLDASSRMAYQNADVVMEANTGRIYIVWEDSRSDAVTTDLTIVSEIFGIYSDNFGATWSAEAKISDPASSTTHEHGPSLAVGRAGDVTALWASARNAAPNGKEEPFFDHSSNGGATWGADGILSTTAPGTFDTSDYNLCSDMNGKVYAFFGLNDHSTPVGVGNAYVRTSTDFGATFPAAPIAVNGSQNYDDGLLSGSCSFASNHAVIAFTSQPSGPFVGQDVYASVSNDGGLTWTTARRMNVGVGVLTMISSELAEDVDTNGNVVVAWDDSRMSISDGFLNYSRDNGATWQDSDIKFTNSPTGTANVYLTDNEAGEYEGARANDRLSFDLTYADTGRPDKGLFHERATFSGSKSGLVRLAGADRVKTGIEISKNGFPTTNAVTAMVVATSKNFPDGLAAGVLAAQVGGPVLLNPQASLDSSVAAEIVRLFDGKADSAPDVYVVGGTAAISDAVVASITALGANISVKRVAGTDRIDSAVKVAQEVDILRGMGPTAALLANSKNFPDALTGSAPASDSAVNGGYMPILLTKPGSLDSRVASYLSSQTASLKNVYVLGGTAAISDSVKAAVDAIIDTVTRLAGSDRYSTGGAIAAFFYKGVLAPMSMGVASGQNFPDALTGGRHSGLKHEPLVLVQKDSVPTASHDYVVANASTIDGGFMYGGTSVVSDTVKAALELIY